MKLLLSPYCSVCYFLTFNYPHKQKNRPILTDEPIHKLYNHLKKLILRFVSIELT